MLKVTNHSKPKTSRSVPQESDMRSQQQKSECIRVVNHIRYLVGEAENAALLQVLQSAIDYIGYLEYRLKEDALPDAA